MSERWKPECGETYYFVDSLVCIGSYSWVDDAVDREYYEIGNCFKTKGEAEAASAKISAMLLSLHDNGTSTANSETLKDTFTEHLKKFAEKPVTDCSQLPKLTAEVFDLPHFPKMADYAVVTEDGGVTAYTHKPYVNNEIPCWGFNRGCSFTVATAGSYDSFGWQNSLIQRPAKLPEWCKVEEWVFADPKKVFGSAGYKKIKATDGLELTFADGCCIYFSDKIKQARPRPYNAEEMKALMGKVIEKGPSMHIVTGFENVFDNECMVHVNGCLYGANDLLRQFTINNKPCGVLEHLENGEWVK